MVKINLLPVRAAAKKEIIRAQLSIGVLLLVMLLIVVGYLHYSISSKIDGLKVSISDEEKELARLNEIKKKVDKFKADSKTLEKKLDVIKVLNQSRTNVVYLMDELSNVMPEGLWLETFRDGGRGLIMTGISMSHDDIADFMTNMERSSMFSAIHLKSTQKQGVKGQDLHKFTVEAIFTPPVENSK